MTFGDALLLVRSGLKVAREGWNGKGMFIFWVDGGRMDHPLFVHYVEALPYIAMYTAQKNVVPWLASQTDVVANDWVGVPCASLIDF
jgi:hypothetical protein